jgi:hypothetical protein
MRAHELFLKQPKTFWANVRTIGEHVGYTNRNKQIKVPGIWEIREKFDRLGLTADHIADEYDSLTPLGTKLFEYFEYRAEVLNNYVEPRLMDAERAAEVFEDVMSTYRSTLPIPMNKQKGEKRTPAYLTAITNILIEAHAAGIGFDHNPRRLTTFALDGMPLRTLARRVDGAFPGTTNPIAIWEIKEYYYTTTFGSRVADGVYESLLDGMELEELRGSEGIHAKHYLIVDAHYTWWSCGRSYLCRILDMLHMGYQEEVLFGYEVVERLPEIVPEWVAEYYAR